MTKELTYCQTVERSILKSYRRALWAPFVKAIKEYDLIQAGDKLAVCISGGKDSMLLAKLMQELHRHTTIPFEVVYLVMDPGYSPANRKRIEENAAKLEIPITIFESDVFAVADIVDGSPCYLCARMRRGCLYAKAQELGCNKIALGHHKSDVIETTVMAMLYGAQIQGMLPKLHSTNFQGMELIRPMYLIVEEDIKRWCAYNDLHFIQCACKKTERLALGDKAMPSARQDVKKLIATLKTQIPEVENHIFRAIHNVQLDTLVQYKQAGEVHTFLERYQDEL